SMRFCPFAQRARLVLAAKGINHETVNINLKEKPDWFLAKNPLGLVPVLETSAGEIIYESPITCDYLDEVYAGKKLFTNPRETGLETAGLLLKQSGRICCGRSVGRYTYLCAFLSGYTEIWKIF
uniref:Glutathione S-transferase omega 1 n=1 Tax=Acanthochromis polyacanthus TaxID=80966 RepID=A0A3Q1ERT0_9TELE